MRVQVSTHRCTDVAGLETIFWAWRTKFRHAFQQSSSPTAKGAGCVGPSHLGGDPHVSFALKRRQTSRGLERYPGLRMRSGAVAGVLGQLPHAWLCGLCSGHWWRPQLSGRSVVQDGGPHTLWSLDPVSYSRNTEGSKECPLGGCVCTFTTLEMKTVKFKKIFKKILYLFI